MRRCWTNARKVEKKVSFGEAYWVTLSLLQLVRHWSVLYMVCVFICILQGWMCKDTYAELGLVPTQESSTVRTAVVGRNWTRRSSRLELALSWVEVPGHNTQLESCMGTLVRKWKDSKPHPLLLWLALLVLLVVVGCRLQVFLWFVFEKEEGFGRNTKQTRDRRE